MKLYKLSMTDYHPVACRTYAELEVSILHQVNLRVSWRTVDGQRRLGSLTPLDLFTRNHEEFLVAETSEGLRLEIRLDRITRFEPLKPVTT